MNDEDAKVFGEGDITIVMNKNSSTAKVYIGTQKIGCIQELKLHLDMKESVPELEIKFPKIPGSAENTKIKLSVEEYVRAVKTIPWIKVS